MSVYKNAVRELVFANRKAHVRCVYPKKKRKRRLKTLEPAPVVESEEDLQNTATASLLDPLVIDDNFSEEEVERQAEDRKKPRNNRCSSVPTLRRSFEKSTLRMRRKPLPAGLLKPVLADTGEKECVLDVEVDGAVMGRIYVLPSSTCTAVRSLIRYSLADCPKRFNFLLRTEALASRLEASVPIGNLLESGSTVLRVSSIAALDSAPTPVISSQRHIEAEEEGKLVWSGEVQLAGREAAAMLTVSSVSNGLCVTGEGQTLKLVAMNSAIGGKEFARWSFDAEMQDQLPSLLQRLVWRDVCPSRSKEEKEVAEPKKEEEALLSGSVAVLPSGVASPISMRWVAIGGGRLQLSQCLWKGGKKMETGGMAMVTLRKEGCAIAVKATELSSQAEATLNVPFCCCTDPEKGVLDGFRFSWPAGGLIEAQQKAKELFDILKVVASPDDDTIEILCNEN